MVKFEENTVGCTLVGKTRPEFETINKKGTVIRIFCLSTFLCQWWGRGFTVKVMVVGSG